MALKPRSSNPPIQAVVGKPCGHIDHVGTCPACQRSQLAKWQAQVAQAQSAGYADAA